MSSQTAVGGNGVGELVGDLVGEAEVGSTVGVSEE